MSEYTHLIGADDVRSAGHNMRAAADDMIRAASTISQSVSDIQKILDNFLIELRSIMEEEG